MLSSVGAGAQNTQDTFSLWSFVTLKTDIGERCYAGLFIEDRTNDLSMIRPIFGVRLTPWLKADIALDQIWKHDSSPAFQQILLSATGTLKNGPWSVSVRERYICSFKPVDDALFDDDLPGVGSGSSSLGSSLDAAPGSGSSLDAAPGSGPSLGEGYYKFGDDSYFTLGHILRSKLTVSYTTERGIWKPYLAVEVFSWDCWKKTRYYLGSDFKLGEHSTFTPFYMYYTFAGKSYGQHTLGLGLQYRF